ncbi:MAG: hypothetical protein KAW12_09585 [Candidatus Aminicenantes bacterium]|nr:hypothetical protein [Candidatus Aminicenantes bacterium]
MDIWTIEKTLPNGFHDAFLQNISIDYVKRELQLDMEILVGDPDAPTEAEREAYKNAHLKLKGLIYCVIEPPDPNYPFSKKEPLWIDIGKIDSSTEPTNLKLPQKIPPEAFSFWMYSSDWNSSFYISAMEAEFSWV